MKTWNIYISQAYNSNIYIQVQNNSQTKKNRLRGDSSKQKTLGWRLPTLAPKDYHRPWSISLPCSEWERVGQPQYSRHLNVFCVQEKIVMINNCQSFYIA